MIMLNSNHRTMINSFDGFKFYESSFNPKTGNLVRAVETKEEDFSDYIKFNGKDYKEKHENQKKFLEKYSYNRLSHAFSPSPETIDIQITNWCDFGCSYCYQDSKKGQRHMSFDLFKKAIEDFEIPPYQVAIGGGEPVVHPHFCEMLEYLHGKGIVPNYTTAGHILKDNVIEATNKFCGGIAMTYHAFKGFKWFKEHYLKLLSVYNKIQLNIHLIADQDVVKNLGDLQELQKLTPLNVVLLAYYPDVGRGTLDRIMSKNIYNKEFPEKLKIVLKEGMKISFSEGLIPFFLSRPKIGVCTKFTTQSEGVFSCAIDFKGNMSKSSFDNYKHKSNVKEKSAQEIWNKGWWGNTPYGGNCYDCELRSSCSVPNVHHYFACAFAEHNKER